MQTIHPRPRSVNDRRAHQCARSGWRPRKRTPRQLTRDIAASIRQHRVAGDSRGIEPSEFTPDAQTLTLVRQLPLLDETPSSAETDGPALSACEADALLRFTRVAEQDDPACVECGAPLELDDFAIIDDTHPAAAIWCSSACAEALAWVERGKKGDISRHVPALSTQEAAAVVLGIIEARLEEDWTLDQIGWQRFCRDVAVIQAVTQELHQGPAHKGKVSSWTPQL